MLVQRIEKLMFINIMRHINIVLLGGLLSTDHLLISSEFSFFIRWSVINRPPIDFVRIFFIY